MHEVIVIADTSCLIAFSKLDAFELLQKMYGRVIITEEIAQEFGELIPEWIIIKQVNEKKYQHLLENTLDIGEASAIALASEIPDVLLILDDLKARKEAQRLGFKITGTLGVLFIAKQRGFIPQLKPYLEKLKIEGFRISEKIEEELLINSNEK